MAPENARQPHTFKVATGKPDQGYGFGRLTVEAGSLSLHSLPGTRLVTQTRGPVTLVTARFAPPWWRTAVILRGDVGVFGAGLSSIGQARRVRDAITQAGFEIDDRETRLWRYPRSSFSRWPTSAP